MSTRNKKKESTLPTAEHLVFPKYYRKDSTYTLQLSETEYTQVQLLKTCTVITRGGNVHTIAGLKDAVVIDKDRYELALKEAQSRLFN